MSQWIKEKVLLLIGKETWWYFASSQTSHQNFSTLIRLNNKGNIYLRILKEYYWNKNDANLFFIINCDSEWNEKSNLFLDPLWPFFFPNTSFSLTNYDCQGSICCGNFFIAQT